MKKYILQALILPFVFNITCNAQSWTVYTTSNSALTNDDYSKICAQGNTIWAGHFLNGVAKFTGGTWTEYNQSNSQLAHDFVKDISADGNGNIWIGTYNGVSKVSSTGVWTRYDTINTTMKGSSITGIAANPANNKVYIFTKNGSFTYMGITLFNGTTWSNLPALPANLNQDPVTHFAFGADNTIWMAMDIGPIGSYNGSTYTMYPAATAQIWSADAMIADASGNMWIAGYDGLVKYSNGTWTYTSSADLGFTGSIAYSGMIIVGNTLWISSTKGLLQYDMINKSVIKIHTTSNSGLPTNSLGEITYANGDIWITSTAGIVKYTPTATGIAENKYSLKVNVYPNPVADEMTVSLEGIELSDQIEIVDITGKQIVVGINRQNLYSLKLDVSELSKGIYSIKIHPKGNTTYVNTIFCKY